MQRSTKSTREASTARLTARGGRSALLAAAAITLISTATAIFEGGAAGTIAVTERTLVLSYRDGNDIVRELQVRRTLTGTFSGSEVSLVHNVTHPDGSADLTVVSSCTCTVEGRTGTVTFSERASVDLDGIITVQRKIIDATGGSKGSAGRSRYRLRSPRRLSTTRADTTSTDANQLMAVGRLPLPRSHLHKEETCGAKTQRSLGWFSLR